MKNTSVTILFVVSILLTLQSCSFQKRKHNSGFYINWSASKMPSLSSMKTVSRGNVELKTKAVNIRSRGSINSQPTYKTKQTSFPNRNKKPLNKDPEPKPENQGKKTNILGIFGLILGFLSYASILLIAFSNYYIEVILSVALFSSIGSLLLNRLSLNQFEKNPFKWKGKALAKLGYVFSITAIILWLLLLIMFVALISLYGF
jgi:hypothetical protein